MKNGYHENKGYDESYENKCATNYSIITNNNWNNTHNKQLTMHNKYTQWWRWLRRLRGAHHALSSHIARIVPHLMMTPHTSWLKFWAIALSSPCHPWRVLFDSISSPFFLYWSFLALSPSSSSIPSCSLSSTTRSSWQVCATPPQMRVRTPWTPSPLTHTPSAYSGPAVDCKRNQL